MSVSETSLSREVLAPLELNGELFTTKFGPKKAIDIAGKVFGRLRVVSLLGTNRNGKVKWLCLCSCGRQVAVESLYIRNGHTKSCGCYALQRISETKTIHGMSQSNEHSIWRKMIERCGSKDSPGHARYGGRGIKVCKRWLTGEGGKNGFQCFYEDMGARPPGLTLERINNDGDYEPNNVKWASRQVQACNRRSNIKVEHDGIKVALSELCRAMGANYERVRYRIVKGGWPLGAALSDPPFKPSFK